MRSLYDQVTQWALQNGGAVFRSADAAECWRLAWAASGIECSVTDFENVLRDEGVLPVQVRNARDGQPGVVQIAIPGRPW